MATAGPLTKVQAIAFEWILITSLYFLALENMAFCGINLQCLLQSSTVFHIFFCWRVYPACQHVSTSQHHSWERPWSLWRYQDLLIPEHSWVCATSAKHCCILSQRHPNSDHRISGRVKDNQIHRMHDVRSLYLLGTDHWEESAGSSHFLQLGLTFHLDAFMALNMLAIYSGSPVWIGQGCSVM